MDSVPPSIPTTNSLLMLFLPLTLLPFLFLSSLFGESSSSSSSSSSSGAPPSPPPPPRSMTTRGMSGVRWAGWEREYDDDDGDDDDDDDVCGRNDGNIIARRRSVDVVVDGTRRRRDDGGRGCVLFAIFFKAEVRQFGRRAIPSKPWVIIRSCTPSIISIICIIMTPHHTHFLVSLAFPPHQFPVHSRILRSVVYRCISLESAKYFRKMNTSVSIHKA